MPKRNTSKRNIHKNYFNKSYEFNELSRFRKKYKDDLVKLKSSLEGFETDQKNYLSQLSPQLYHHLLVKTENDFVCPEPCKFFKYLHRNVIHNILWEPKEYENFFIALERCGKHNPIEISRRLGTKNVLQVMMLIELLEYESNLAKTYNTIHPVNYIDIPSAREMSDNWLKFEKIQVEIIQERINKIETKKTIEENMQPIFEWDEKKLELFEVENLLALIKKYTTDDIHINRASITTLYHILQNWLRGIIKNLITLNDHYQKLHTQEEHKISEYDVYKALKFYGYKFSNTNKASNSQNFSSDYDDENLSNHKNHKLKSCRYCTNLGHNIRGCTQYKAYLAGKDNDSLLDEDNMQVDIQQPKDMDIILNESREDSDNYEPDIEVSDSYESDVEDSDVDEFLEMEDSRYNYCEDVANHKMLIDYDNKIECKEQKVDELYEKAFLRVLIEPTNAESTDILNEITNLEYLLDTDLRSYSKIFDDLSEDEALDSNVELEDLQLNSEPDTNLSAGSLA